MASKNKEINHSQLVTIKPITDSQKVVFDTWKKGRTNFCLVQQAQVRHLFLCILRCNLSWT